MFFFRHLRRKCVRLRVQRSEVKPPLKQNGVPLLWCAAFKAVVKEDLEDMFTFIICKPLFWRS